MAEVSISTILPNTLPRDLEMKVCTDYHCAKVSEPVFAAQLAHANALSKEIEREFERAWFRGSLLLTVTAGDIELTGMLEVLDNDEVDEVERVCDAIRLDAHDFADTLRGKQTWVFYATADLVPLHKPDYH